MLTDIKKSPHLRERPSLWMSCGRTLSLAGWVVMWALTNSPLAADYAVVVQSQTLETDDLDRIQATQPKKHFSHSYRIPYSTLEPQLEQALGVAVDQVIQSELGGYSQTYECSYPCDWVSWQILNPAVTFQFTDESQPEITAINDGTGVEVRLRTAARIRYTGKVRGKINTDFTSPATPGGTDEEDFPFDIKIDASVAGFLRLNLYPTLAVDQFNVVFDGDPKVDINGFAEVLAAEGAELGTKIGFTPGGIITGGPLAWGLTGAIFGNEGGEILEEWVESLIQTYISAGIEQGFDEVSSRLEAIVGAADLQAQNIQQQLLNTSVPGTGQTVAQLQSSFGLSFDVRAQTPGTDVRVTITARLDPQAASQGFSGRLLIPKKKCIQGYDDTLGTIPGPTVDFNTSFAAQVGQPCAQILPDGGNAGLQSRVFLGHQPPGTSLPLWEDFGQVALKGNLGETDDYFHCAFKVTGLPLASVVEIAGSSTYHQWIGKEHMTNRYLLVGKVLLSHTFDRARIAHLGGTTGCDSGGSGSTGLQLTGPAAVAEEIENCPQCGPLARRPGTEQSNPGVATGLREQGFNPQPDPPRARIARRSALVAGSVGEVAIQIPVSRKARSSLRVELEILAGRQQVHQSTAEMPPGVAEVPVRFNIPRGAKALRFVVTVHDGNRSVTTSETQPVAPRRRGGGASRNR